MDLTRALSCSLTARYLPARVRNVAIFCCRKSYKIIVADLLQKAMLFVTSFCLCVIIMMNVSCVSGNRLIVWTVPPFPQDKYLPAHYVLALLYTIIGEKD